VIHEIPLERRTLHGHFSRDLEPVLTIDSGDTITISAPDAGWGLEGGPGDRRRFEPRDRELDAGHPLIGPVEVRGARPGHVLEIAVGAIRVGPYGFTDAGGWRTSLNTRLGVSKGDTHTLWWELDAAAGLGRDQNGREVELRPFLGVLGMPPPEPGLWSTGPPRIWGGNLDCKELVSGSTLFLPVPLEGALFSAGDCHARQGDGEVSQLAIECPVERAELTLRVRADLELRSPIARTTDAWLALGLDKDLDKAAASAVEGMIELMEREYGLERRDALALASVAVDLRVTQIVNRVKGVHAVLPHDAIRFMTMR
jgi:acetamidase/formamidase